MELVKAEDARVEEFGRSLEHLAGVAFRSTEPHPTAVTRAVCHPVV